MNRPQPSHFCRFLTPFFVSGCRRRCKCSSAGTVPLPSFPNLLILATPCFASVRAEPQTFSPANSLNFGRALAEVVPGDKKSLAHGSYRDHRALNALLELIEAMNTAEAGVTPADLWPQQDFHCQSKVGLPRDLLNPPFPPLFFLCFFQISLRLTLFLTLSLFSLPPSASLSHSLSLLWRRKNSSDPLRAGTAAQLRRGCLQTAPTWVRARSLICPTSATTSTLPSASSISSKVSLGRPRCIRGLLEVPKELPPGVSRSSQ